MNVPYFIFTQYLNIWVFLVRAIKNSASMDTEYILLVKKKKCVIYLGMESMDYRVYVCLDLIDSATVVQSGL